MAIDDYLTDEDKNDLIIADEEYSRGEYYTLDDVEWK